MARKQRPFYYASEEQYRWLQIIAGKLDPTANLADVQQLKKIAASLENGIDSIKRGRGVGSPEDEERPEHSPSTPINIEQEEGMEGVVEGIGTLMLDPLGRPSIHPFVSAELTYARIRRGICICCLSQKSQRLCSIPTA